MPFCVACGTENNVGVNFCQKCGASQGASTVVSMQNSQYNNAPMSFTESIKSCLAKYADFKGRASRSEFWWFNLFYVVVMIVASIINEYLVLIAYFGLFLPLCAASIRRLHDGNRSGWFYLLALIPLVNIVLLVWFCQRGTIGLNQYGPDPIVVA